MNEWLAHHYHGPSDDLMQPANFEATVVCDAMYFDVVQTVADRETRPAWCATNVFRSNHRSTQ